MSKSLIEHTDSRWLELERKAEAIYVEQRRAEMANVKQLLDAARAAKRLNLAHRRCKVDQPWGADDLVSVLVFAVVIAASIGAVFL